MVMASDPVWIIRCGDCERLDPAAWWGSLEEAHELATWACERCRSRTLYLVLVSSWDLQYLRGLPASPDSRRGPDALCLFRRLELLVFLPFKPGGFSVLFLSSRIAAPSTLKVPTLITRGSA